MKTKFSLLVAFCLLVGVIATGCKNGSEPKEETMVEWMTADVEVDTCGCKGSFVEKIVNRKIKLYIDTLTDAFTTAMFEQHGGWQNYDESGYFYFYKNKRFFSDTLPDVYLAPTATMFFNSKSFLICNFPVKLSEKIANVPNVVEIEFSGMFYDMTSFPVLITGIPPGDLYLTSFKVPQSILIGGKK